MSIECGECERDLRGGHAPGCSRSRETKLLEAMRAALVAALPVLEEAAETSMYGHYTGGDPRLFSPAEDECTPEEIAAHKAACEAWERGERPDIPHACEPSREDIEITDKTTGEKTTIAKGTGLALYAPFGVGIQTWRDEEAMKARDLVRAALEGT
jgi:hypothetical protein